MVFFSGGFGKITKKLWKEPEAKRFMIKAIEMGVQKEKIVIEEKSTNTGDNFRFTERLIQENKLNIKSFIIVNKPYKEKRTFAIFNAIMPQYQAILHPDK